MKKTFMTMDGNMAAAFRAYPFSEIAAIYPITPSSPMASHTDIWAAKGRNNMFGQPVKLTEMQSEAGAIGAVHGAAQTGALATSFTSSQGLMLMVPVLYRIAGERLPVVVHVAARTLGTHAMSIFGDHSDVMVCRDTGFALLSTASVQEVADLAPVAHLAAIESGIPFMHFFDGFRTSHEINKVEMIDEEEFVGLIDKDALKQFKDGALNPDHPHLRSSVQNGDVYFQVREANNKDYDALPEIVEKYFARVSELTGREYHLFDYYGAPDATDVVVAMGSVKGAIEQAITSLIAKGRKVGFVQVHLYRPFSVKHFIDALPESVKRIAVLDRCKNMGSLGEPLYEDVCSAIMEEGKAIRVIGGRYGLSSKDTFPAQIVAVFDNLCKEKPITSFTVGIVDDVTNKSLPLEHFESQDHDMYECKFWGLGGDGTVGANHNTVKIINENTEKYGQAYFEYDAKKSLGVTKSHLRFSNHPIDSSYFVKEADFVACHSTSYINQYDIVGEVKDGGVLLLNCPWGEEELSERLSANVKKAIAERDIKLYIIDATEIAMELGLGSHTNTVLQAAFFAISEVIPKQVAIDEMKKAIISTYSRKGQAIVDMNISAVIAGSERYQQVEIPESWKDCVEIVEEDDEIPAIVKEILEPMNKQKGDDLPVSAFVEMKDGRTQLGLTAYEKRGFAALTPIWEPSKCIQCNQCSFVCPHACIRPFVLDAEEASTAPDDFSMLKLNAYKGDEDYKYSIQISKYDCTGCGSCVAVCPSKEKAITMAPADLKEEDKINWEYAMALRDKGDLFNPYTVKGSQFRQPLLEFSAACAGCGETPYAKLMTQLFGDRIYWANATGCSQAWGAAMPGIPYTTNSRGHGPAWSNSLFENNAELSFGMLISVKQQRELQKKKVEQYFDESASEAARAWLDSFDDFEGSRVASDALVDDLEKSSLPIAKEILERKDQLTKKTFWMYGGDGWAYDIGFGGLDHVIATGEDINVLIVDTELYSNTGGQSSKATPKGAVAQFAAAGKPSVKKDIGAILRTYGNVYVAQVAMGANQNQLVKALKEAIEYKGPSVIIAYATCAIHGIKGGMANSQAEMKKAVDSGYWTLYRYNPDNEHPLTVDSKEPSVDYKEFLNGEVRFTSLVRTFPENADKLFESAAQDAAKRYADYKKQEEL